MIAACALAHLRVSPVIVIQIPFGRDNHQDSTLEIEDAETRRGVASLELMWNELNRLDLRNEVTFAMLNVFGRNFHTNSRGGRDHNRHHGVMVAFGRHINGGVYGGVTGEGHCRNIRPRDGRPVNNGGISADDTLASAGRSLAAALGHTNAEINHAFTEGKSSTRSSTPECVPFNWAAIHPTIRLVTGPLVSRVFNRRPVSTSCP